MDRDEIYDAFLGVLDRLIEEQEKNWALETEIMNLKFNYRRMNWLRKKAMLAYGKLANKVDNMTDDELYQRSSKR